MAVFVGMSNSREIVGTDCLSYNKSETFRTVLVMTTSATFAVWQSFQHGKPPVSGQIAQRG